MSKKTCCRSGDRHADSYCKLPTDRHVSSYCKLPADRHVSSCCKLPADRHVSSYCKLPTDRHVSSCCKLPTDRHMSSYCNLSAHVLIRGSISPIHNYTAVFLSWFAELHYHWSCHSVRSPSLTQPSLRQPILITGANTAGNTKHMRMSPAQSIPVIAAFAPDATSVAHPE